MRRDAAAAGVPYLTVWICLELPAERQLLLQASPVHGTGRSLCSRLLLQLQLRLELLLLLLEVQQLLVLLSCEPGACLLLGAFAGH